MENLWKSVQEILDALPDGIAMMKFSNDHYVARKINENWDRWESIWKTLEEALSKLYFKLNDK